MTTEKSDKPVKKYQLLPSININIPTYEECQKITLTTPTTNTTLATITKLAKLDTTNDRANVVNEANVV